MKKIKSRKKTKRPNNARKHKEKPQKKLELPDQIQQRFVLLDEDDFYGYNVDLVLYNFSEKDTVKISNKYDFEALLTNLKRDGSHGNYYLIDEIFLQSDKDLDEIVNVLKEVDEKGKIIVLTTLADAELRLATKPDKVVVKSKRNSELSLVRILADLLDKEFVEDNNDPEYTGSDYMETLKQNLKSQ
jgi:hypothetical protein